MKKNRERRVAYNSVIQDLYAKRVQLNQAIEALEAVVNEESRARGSATSQAFAAAEHKVNGSSRSDSDETGGTLIAAIKAVLRRSDRPLGNAEIFRQLKAAGVKFRSSNPQLSVSQVLSRNSKTSGAPVRVGRGRWALQ
ncbi:MAG: hypothetical protein JO188_22290 [Hyphomicrobiales bacterium]|nr:hypothetical protein [Hyphomicrobiales bacterium]